MVHLNAHTTDVAFKDDPRAIRICAAVCVCPAVVWIHSLISIRVLMQKVSDDRLDIGNSHEIIKKLIPG